ncbi:MAG TPA: SIS domain-containing protein [Verrucomicrobiae bacterium]|nr:SIS domain-containing protein [Verrucomicrobiae bacterium]
MARLAHSTESVARVADQLVARNPVCRQFFSREAHRLAAACQAMSERFRTGGRLLAFGRGSYSTDAQHIAVEFVHPVIVGKRALPALDLSPLFGPWLRAILRPEDIVVGFGPPQGDPEVAEALCMARAAGAMTLALPGPDADYSCDAACHDPFVHQEVIEILYHTLWETVHVFLEHRQEGLDTGDAGFLYPFLGGEQRRTADLIDEVAVSILMKVADDERLREEVAAGSAGQIWSASEAITERIARRGKLILFGNGGSATDANDFAFDCVLPPSGYQPVPAVSLAMEPAIITAVANDVGTDLIFLRQLIAQAGPEDVAIGISTSGGSRNIIAALEEARKRKLLTVALLGSDGGEIRRRGLAGFSIVVPCDYIPRIQEVQASIYHVIRENLELIHRARA